MSPLTVRQYKDSDHHVVIRIFTQGCYGLALPAFCGSLRFPQNWLLLLAGFLLPLITLGSIFLAFLDVLLILLVLWLCGREFFHSYARKALAKDLKDIRKYYLQQKGYNFWVAESNNEVVGIVAALPFYLPGGEKHIELQRMSVARNHRGKGIAQVLCKTVIDFARKEGCKAIVLSTTTIQKDAIHLYQKMGFRSTQTSYMTQLTERLAGLEWIYLRYDIS